MIKTIDVLAKQWRDKVYGNSYFSARVVLDLDCKGNGRTFFLPYEYGYGEQYLYSSFDAIIKAGLLPAEACACPTRYCRENGIILRHGIQNGCTKRDVIAWGKAPEGGK